MPEQLIARPYTFDQVGGRTVPDDVRPAFELSVGPSMPSSLIEPARAEARASGYAAGWAQGIQEAREQMAADVERSRLRADELDATRAAALQRALTAIDQAATELRSRAVPAIERLEDTVVAMAMEIAEALVGHELQVGTRLGLDALARTLTLAPEDGPIIVHLSPADYAAVGGSQDYAALTTTRAITLAASPELANGDALARCGATQIDARIAPAIVRVKEALGR